jgi:hypothetical protein
MKQIEGHLKLLARHGVDCVIVGGVAAIVHGSSQLTYDLDVCYDRASANLTRLVGALRSVNARLRGAPKELPFILDEETIHHGLNFTLETDIGALDLLGEVAGVGDYAQASENAETRDLFGLHFPVLALAKLIAAKRAAGRPKDLLAIPELEAISDFRKGGKSESS